MPGLTLTGIVNQGFVPTPDEAAHNTAATIHVPVEHIQLQAVALAVASTSRSINGNSNGGSHAQNPKPRIVVHVEDANITYGSGPKAKHVLKDLCMAVEEHTIYGILGASGCGKTTILSCIVALRKLDSGSILICGDPTGSVGSGIPGKKVGYMPQELALNGEFTIVEVLAYFGRIFGMGRSEIKNRTKYLLTLLSLRGLNQQIVNLSDGQKRRVSMAVALIHEPDLLVLDEPTVGCDPLLRETIWNYLQDLVATKSATVVVSTHYIEEMRMADRIGIMRSGRMLCEESPGNLLQMFNESLLDSVVVTLCQQDEGPRLGGGGGSGSGGAGLVNGGGCGPDASSEFEEDGLRLRKRPPNWSTATNVIVEWSLSTTNRERQRKRRQLTTTHVFHRLHGLLVKDFLVMLRNWAVTIIISLIPATIIAFMSMAVNFTPEDLRIGFVNYEMGVNCSLDSGAFNLTYLTEGNCLQDSGQGLSCAFLQAMDREAITLIPFETEDDAEDEALAGRIWGYFWFNERFSEHFFKRYVLNDLSDNATLTESEISVRLDTAGAEQTTQFIQGKFMKALQKMSTSLHKACSDDGIDGSMKDGDGGDAGAGVVELLQFGAPIFSFGRSKKVERSSYSPPGCLVGILFFMSSVQCGLAYIVEKKDGMLSRTFVTGVTQLEIILSYFLIQLFVIVLSQIGVSFCLVFVIFGAVSEGSMLLSFVLVFLNCIVGMSIGFLLATFCSDEKYAIILALGLMLPNFFLAGLLWPIERLPPALLAVCQYLPTTIVANGFRSITTRGFDASYEVVWMGFVATGVWTGSVWLVIILWHRFGQRKH